MAFQTGTVTDMQDLVTTFFTFAVANGWVQDELDVISDPHTGSIHKNNMFMHFWWKATGPIDLEIFQSTGFTPSNEPFAHPGDSGTYATTPAIENFSIRGCENMGDGSMDYWFFQGNGTQEYLYAVVRLASNDTYQHFGIGEIDKFGVWNGGEYCYGTIWNNQANPVGISTYGLSLDAGFSASTPSLYRNATMKVDGLPGMDPAIEWGTFNNTNSLLSNLHGVDRAGNDRAILIGGMRGGMFAHGFSWLRQNTFNEFVPLIPIVVWWRDNAVPQALMYLGKKTDCRMMNMRNFSPADEFAVGGDTWIVFPAIKKLTDITNTSRNLALAYKKLV